MGTVRKYRPTPAAAPPPSKLWSVVTAPCFLAFAAVAVSFPLWFMPATVVLLKTFLVTPDGTLLWVIFSVALVASSVAIGIDIFEALLPNSRIPLLKKANTNGIPRFFGLALIAILLLQPLFAAQRVFAVLPDQKNFSIDGKEYQFTKLKLLAQIINHVEHTLDFRAIQVRLSGHEPEPWNSPEIEQR